MIKYVQLTKRETYFLILALNKEESTSYFLQNIICKTKTKRWEGNEEAVTCECGRLQSRAERWQRLETMGGLLSGLWAADIRSGGRNALAQDQALNTTSPDAPPTSSRV